VLQLWDKRIVAIEKRRKFKAPTEYLEGTCFVGRKGHTAAYRFDLCLVPSSTETNVLLWGDSLATQYYPGLSRIAPSAGYHILQATYANCPPLVGDYRTDIPGCRKFNDDIRRRIPDTSVKAIILSGGWRSADMSALRALIAELLRHKLRVVLVGPSISYTVPKSNILAKQILHPSTQLDTKRYLAPGQMVLDRQMAAEFSGINGVYYISVLQKICANQCPLQVGEEPMQIDQLHLTSAGSLFIAQRIFPKAFIWLRSGAR